MKHVSILVMLIPATILAMDKHVASAKMPGVSRILPQHAMNNSYFQRIASLQTPQGKLVVEFYFMQLLKLKMPNDLPFQMGLEYLDERSHCDLPGIVLPLKNHINDVLQSAFAMRDKALAPEQTGDELARAVKHLNAIINKHPELREQWVNIGIALKAYHKGLTGTSIRVALKRKKTDK